MSNAEKVIEVVLVGVGGYGKLYVNAMLDEGPDHGARLVAVVDPMAANAERMDEVSALGIPIYDDLESCFVAHAVDVVVISSPIHLHCEQIQRAVAAGAHVLCEKPLTGSLEEGLQTLAAAKAANRLVAVGYQWSYCSAVQALKADLIAGRFGAPQRFRSLVLWPRPAAYYARNNWAGRQRLADGRPVFDSPANNACAHYLHNMLYLLGPTRERSADPVTVEAELYRAKPIENFDTAAIRCRTGDGVELLFYTSHAVAETVGPTFSLECEDAVISGGAERGTEAIEARCADGEVISYGLPTHGADKLWALINAVRGGVAVACPLRAALPQTVVIAAANRSTPTIVDFPGTLIETVGEPDSCTVVARGLGEALEACYAEGVLPSQDGGHDWARPAQVVDTSDWLPAG